MTNKLILGKDQNSEFIKVDGYQYVILFAPTVAVKSVSFVLQNLLSNQDSLIVHDIKGENYVLTKTKRESFGHKIYI